MQLIRSVTGLSQVLLAADLVPFRTDQMLRAPRVPPADCSTIVKHRVKCACLRGAGDRQVVVVDYSAAWCGPCHMMEPVLAGWARELAPRVVFIKADAEAAGNRQLAGGAGIRCASQIPPHPFASSPRVGPAALTGSHRLRRVLQLQSVASSTRRHVVATRAV